MKKKLVSVFLAAVMAGTLVTGCGNEGGKEATNSPAGSDAAEAGAADSNNQGNNSAPTNGDTVNLVMQFPVLGDTPAGLDDVEAALNEITEKEIGVTVTLLPGNAYNLNTETSLAVSSGEKLDICLSIYAGVGSLVEQGLVIPLGELVESNGPDIIEKCGDQLSAGNYGPELYSLPCAYVNGADWAFIADKAALDKADVTIDESKYYSIEELEEIFDKVMATQGNNYHIFAGASGSNSDIRPFCALNYLDDLGAGIGMLFDSEFNTDGNIVNYFESEEFASMCNISYRWAQKGFFSPDAANCTEAASSQVAAGIALGEFQQRTPSLVANFGAQIGRECIAIRTLPAYMYSKAYQNSLWGITTSCEYPQKAMDLLNLLYCNPDVDNLLMYGLEGQSYEIQEQDGDGTVITLMENSPYFNPFGVYGDRFSWYVTPPATTSTNQEEREMSKAVTQKSPALGFVPSYTNVSSEYTAVLAVINQYIGILDSGALDPAQELPEFLDALKDAGIDKVLEEVQAQYETWKGQQ